MSKTIQLEQIGNLVRTRRNADGSGGFLFAECQMDKTGKEYARRIVACVNALEGISTEYLETVGLPEFAGKTLCADAVQSELDAATAKVADLELALFAENQTRQDVERQRDELAANLEAARNALLREGKLREQLMSALEPFADAHDTWNGGNAPLHFSTAVVPAHFLAAAEAIAAVKGGEPC